MSLELEKVAMQTRITCAIVALTPTGLETALRVKEAFDRPSQIYTLPKLAKEPVCPLIGSPKKAIAEIFQQVEVLICIMATGIVVRSLASVISDKATDPAVLVMDEKARNIISLLSGHLGGANQLTQQLAISLKSNPVITTATDVQDVVALDNLAKSVNGWTDDLRPSIKIFNSYLAQKKPVYFFQEKEWVTDTRGLIILNKEELEDILKGDLPLIILQTKDLERARPHQVLIKPKPYILGVGARKNVSAQVFREGFELFCQRVSILPEEIAKVVSIDVKKEEQAILSLVEELSCSFETFSKEELSTVADKYPQSEFVKKMVGVGSVALASADLASEGQVISDRFARDGCTYALAKVKIGR